MKHEHPGCCARGHNAALFENCEDCKRLRRLKKDELRRFPGLDMDAIYRRSDLLYAGRGAGKHGF